MTKTHPEKPAPDDELSIDFSKAKDFFKKIGSTFKKITDNTKDNTKKHVLTDTPTDETDTLSLSIDTKKVWSFTKKHYITIILLAILAMQFVPNGEIMPWGGVWMRMQTADQPFVDGIASVSVNNFFRNQIRSELDQQYPHLPEAQKNEIVEEEWIKFRDSNKEQLDQNKEGTIAELKSSFQYEEGGEKRPYMPDIDPYYYLRFARNIKETGTPWDEVRNGVEIDNHMLAPNGKNYEHSIHPYTLYTIFVIFNFFDSSLDLMQAAAFFPVLFILLSLIPAFFIGRRVGGIIGGIFTATFIAISPAIMGRTIWGHADTDAYNIFFPLIIVWLLFESFAEKNVKKRIVYGSLSGIALGLYSFSWQGWWYLFDFIIGGMIIYTIYLLFAYVQQLKSFFKIDVVRSFLITAASFVVSTGIVASFFLGTIKFFKAPLQPILFSTIKNAVDDNFWPNVLTTVAELNPGSFNAILGTVGGQFLFVIGLLGIVLIALTTRDEKGKPDIKYSALLIIWFIGTIYASLKGIRFTLLLAPAFAIAFGAFCGIVYTYLSKAAEKEFHIKKIITGTILFIIFGLLLVVTELPKDSYKTAINDRPIVDDAWWDTLTKIREESATNAVINSWWDFGHHFKYIADRRVTFDGGTQNKPMAHWIGKVLMTPDENEARGILRMLDCGSNNAFDVIIETTQDPLLTISIINQIIILDKEEARKVLEASGIRNIEKVLEFSHCKPPENYFITSGDMIGKAGVWGHFGTWDFEKAYIWSELKNIPRQQALEEMKKRFSYTQEKAEKTYAKVQSIKLEGDPESAVNRWIAPGPGFLNANPSSCTIIEEGTIECDNNVRIINGTAFIVHPQGLQAIYSLAIINDEGEFEEVLLEEESQLSIVLMPTRTGFENVVVSRELAASMFVRLFYLQGHGLEHFKLFSQKHQVFGGPYQGKISTWKINWEGGEPNQHAATIVKTTVSPGDLVGVEYIGWFDNETVFDTTIKEEGKIVTPQTLFSNTNTQPIAFEAGKNQMIPGFDEAVLTMSKGEERIITIPPEKAYGNNPEAHPFGGETLHFKILLQEIR